MSHTTQTGSDTAAATPIGAHLLVKTPGAAVVTAASTDEPIGVTTGAVEASAQFAYDRSGRTFATASAAITAGDTIMPAAAGKIAAWTATNRAIGVAIQAASGDGHVIEIELDIERG